MHPVTKLSILWSCQSAIQQSQLHSTSLLLRCYNFVRANHNDRQVNRQQHSSDQVYVVVATCTRGLLRMFASTPGHFYFFISQEQKMEVYTSSQVKFQQQPATCIFNSRGTAKGQSLRKSNNSPIIKTLTDKRP